MLVKLTILVIRQPILSFHNSSPQGTLGGMDTCAVTSIVSSLLWWIVAAGCGLGSFALASKVVNRVYAKDPGTKRFMDALTLPVGFLGFFVGYYFMNALPFMDTLRCQ